MNTPRERMFVGNCVPAASLDDFIGFWAWLYPDRVEPEYTSNIGCCCTFRQVQMLFHWKFPRFAEYHREKLKADFEDGKLRWFEGMSGKRYLQGDFKTPGMIWRLFWLHCCCPESFPIFDQHVHRAMVFIQDGGDRMKIEFDAATAIPTYLDRYLFFHQTFHAIKNRGAFDREIDRALYMFGQTLARKNWAFGT